MNFRTSVNDFQNCDDFKNLKNYRRLFKNSRGIDIFKCEPVYIRNGTEEERQNYYNEWGFMSLLHPLENEQKEDTKEQINNIKLYHEDFKRLGKKGGKIKDIFNNFCNLIKWHSNDLNNLINNNISIYKLDIINNMYLNTYNGSLNTYIFDSFVILCSYNEPLYIYDIREAGRSGRTFINPEYTSQATGTHKNHLLEYLYINDVLSNYINM